MKYWKLFVLMAILVLAVAGCGDKGTQVVTPTNNQPSANTQATGGGAASAGTSLVSLELSAAEKSLAEDKLKKGENVAVSTSYKVMGIGDVYVFGVGVKNIYPNSNNYRLAPKLLNAKSSGLANIITTDSTIESWLSRNRFTSFTLEGGETIVEPLIIEVGTDVSATGKTEPGSYTFDVVVEYESSKGFWDKYNTGEDLLVIKVK